MKRRRIATRRAVLLQAWRGAQRRIDQAGALELAPDEEAGRLLTKWTSANVAHALASGEAVQMLLAEVVIEEGGAVYAHGRNAS